MCVCEWDLVYNELTDSIMNPIDLVYCLNFFRFEGGIVVSGLYFCVSECSVLQVWHSEVVFVSTENTDMI